MKEKRHIRAVFQLPFVVTVVIPVLLLWLVEGVGDAILFLVGIIFLFSGVTLLTVTIYLFKHFGKGTLAPWDPPQELVMEGPYRYVRNPMISGVLATLIGESLLEGSLALGIFAGCFFLLNHAYFIFWEEPRLAKRFGEAYLQYQKEVPRWIPLFRSRDDEVDKPDA